MGVDLSDVKRALSGELKNVIFRGDTASGILGISNLWLTDRYEVYSDKLIDISGLDVIVVPSLAEIPYTEVNGVKVTTEVKTFQDMLDDACDGFPSQSLLESLSYYYETHNQSFSGLEAVLNSSQLKAFEMCKQDAIEYYNDD